MQVAILADLLLNQAQLGRIRPNGVYLAANM